MTKDEYNKYIIELANQEYFGNIYAAKVSSEFGFEVEQ